MFASAIRSLIDLLFPSSSEERCVASLSAVEFLAQVSRWHNDSVLRQPNVFSPFIYRDKTVKTAIHLAKYRGKKSVCYMLGEALWDVYGEDIMSFSFLENIRWDVVPVPLSSRKRRVRGYNQSEEIACGFLARADPNIFSLTPNLLRRTSTKESQTKTLSRRERVYNVKNSFEASGAAHGKCVLLIDDVVTTGATLTEAARALKKLGARRILCLAVAH